MYVLYFSLIVVRLLRLALGFVHNFSAKWNEIHQINQANIRHNPRDNIKATQATQVTKSSTASSSGQPRPACSSQQNSHLAPQRPVPPTSAPECERHPRQTLNDRSLDCSISSSSSGSSRDASRSESPHLTPIARPPPSESRLCCLEPLNMGSVQQAGNSEPGPRQRSCLN